MNGKITNSRRIGELALVLVLTIVPVMMSSFNSKPVAANLDHSGISLRFILMAMFYCTSIALMFYVVLNQDRSLKEIGISFQWTDILVALLLIAIVYGGTAAYGFLRIYFWKGGVLNTGSQSIQFMVTKITFPFIFFLTASACFEELIVRGYLMTETYYFTNSRFLAVIVSVALQISYHSYQGGYVMWRHTLFFLPFAVYFAFWRRVTPVILAHLGTNLMITFRSGQF